MSLEGWPECQCGVHSNGWFLHWGSGVKTCGSLSPCLFWWNSSMNRIGEFKPHWLLTTHDMDLYLQDCSFFCIVVVLFPFARIGELHVNSMFGTWPELQFLTWQVPSGKNVNNYANVDLICLLSFLQIESGPSGSSGPNSSDFLNSFSPWIRLDLVFARSHCTGTTSGCSLAWMGVQLLAILRSEVTQNKPAITLRVVLSIFGDESLVGRLVLDITTVKNGGWLDWLLALWLAP